MQLRLMRWIGGKIRVIHILTALFPDNFKVYCEPFIGSGAVLLNKCRHTVEIINDKNKDLATLHRVLADRVKGKQLVDILTHQIINEEIFYEALQTLEERSAEIDDIEGARCVFLKYYLSFNAKGDFYRPMTQDEYNRDVRYQLPNIYERYLNVEVRTGCGVELIRQVADNENAFVFADPPYDRGLRNPSDLYENDISKELQSELLKAVKNAKCKILLCGYAAEGCEYDTTLIPTGRWKRYELARLPKSLQVNKKERDVAVEYIWVNYELPSFAKYMINMGTEFSAKDL